MAVGSRDGSGLVDRARDAVHVRGELEVEFGQATCIMRREMDVDSAVDVRPFWMVVHFLRQNCDFRHETEGFGEIAEFEFAVEFVAFQLPAR